VCGAPRGFEDTTHVGQLADLAGALDADSELAAAIASTSSGTALLVVRRGPNAPSRYLLGSDETLIGRDAEADVFLDDITVSRRHACVRRTSNGFEVEDLESLNGTYVDGELVTHAALHHLAELCIGTFLLVVIVPEPAVAGT
jgi:pSer/pThr/pTyr-binding forkhead associated (FHA) protein